MSGAIKVVSFSEIDAMRQCQHKHQLSYQERWRSPRTSPALSKGTLWHEVMDAHYRVIKDHQDSKGKLTVPALDLASTVQEVVSPLVYPTRGEQSEEQALIEWMYQGYVEMWGLDEQWQILAVEHEARAPLPTPTGGRSRIVIKMKMDLIVRDVGAPRKIWIVDHKSGRNLPKDKELDIDDQFGLYTWGLQRMGKPVFGSIHNAARTQRNKDQTKHPQPLDERFQRSRMFRTEQELESIAHEAYATVRHAYGIKGDKPRSPNPDTCRWRCDYLDACLMGRKTSPDREREMLRDMGFVQDFTRH